jgi:hypothetical protein
VFAPESTAILMISEAQQLLFTLLPHSLQRFHLLPLVLPQTAPANAVQIRAEFRAEFAGGG